MTRKIFLAFAGVAAVLLIAGVWLSAHRANEQADIGGGAVFTDLKPALGDIKALGMRMKVINVLFVPLVFTGLALLVAAWNRRRRHAIAMLRKGGPA